MSDGIVIHPVRADDPSLRTMLGCCGLPTDDLEEAGRLFFMASANGSAQGCGGFETAGPDVLLRSVAVDPARRQKGIGKALVEHILERARQSGAARAYLLTTTAAPFFERLGFSRIDRAAAPQAILETRQAAALCPASAMLMMKDMS